MKNYLPFLMFVFCVISGCSDNGVASPDIKGDLINSSYASAMVEKQMETENFDLMQIMSGDVDEEGFAKEWMFVFLVGASPDSCYYYSITSKSAVVDSVQEAVIGISILNESLDNLLSSSEAIVVAQNNGGAEFINDYPNTTTIDVSLIKPVIPNSVPLWYINYSSPISSSMLFFKIDAVTGEMI